MNRLPPAQHRTRPALAAAVGWLPFGQAAYFRTGADVLVAIVLVIPMAAAGGAIPDPEAEEAGAKTPIWAGAMLWTVVVVGALYAYLRSLSSNRAIELSRIARRAAAEPPADGAPEASSDERRRLLERRLRELAPEGWTQRRRRDFEAVVVRTPETDHRRQAKLTALTLGLWGFAWIYLAFCRNEERDVEVDRWGVVRVAIPGWTACYLRPALTRLRAPGCYAYQIDGSTFSRLIVFRCQNSVHTA
jgi:hypothetical protein